MNKIDSEFNNICNEMGFKSIESKKLKRSFARYRRQRISNRSSFQIDTTKFFVNEIESNINLGIKDMNKLIENIQKVIPTKIRDQFSTEEEISEHNCGISFGFTASIINLEFSARVFC